MLFMKTLTAISYKIHWLLILSLLIQPIGTLAKAQQYHDEYQFSYTQDQQPAHMSTKTIELHYQYDDQGNRTLKQLNNLKQPSTKNSIPKQPKITLYSIPELPIPGMQNLHFWPSSGHHGQAISPLKLHTLTRKTTKTLWQPQQHAKDHWVYRTELSAQNAQNSFVATFIQVPEVDINKSKAQQGIQLRLTLRKSKGAGFAIYSNGELLTRINLKTLNATRTISLNPGPHVLVFRAYSPKYTLQTAHSKATPVQSKDTAIVQSQTDKNSETGAFHYVEIHKLELSVATDSNNNYIADSLEYHLLQTLNHQSETTLNTLDSDQDGLTDLQELTLLANPKAKDSDADGLPDAYEHQQGWPLNHDSAFQDADQDGIFNIEEFLQGSDPKDPISGKSLLWHFDNPVALLPNTQDPASTEATVNNNIQNKTSNPSLNSPTWKTFPFWSATSIKGKFNKDKGAQDFGQPIINEQGQGWFRIHHSFKTRSSLYLSTRFTSIGAWLRLSLRKKAGSQWDVYLNQEKQAYQSDCDKTTDISVTWCTLKYYIPEGQSLITFRLKPKDAWVELDNLFIPRFPTKM